MSTTVVLGLSGGVDSAVAARLLQENYTVIGLYLSIGPEAAGEADARRVAEELGIEFHTMDISRALEEHVKAPFAAQYLSGRTPLPCARCNPLVKFPAMLALAHEVGAEWVTTGHYARTEMDKAGRSLLLKGRPANDQSYMLSRLPREIIQRVIFPLGDYDKSMVRIKAEAFGIPVAHKPDSMEICFIPDDDYGRWLENRGQSCPPGDFIAPDGTVLGRHRGIHRYTLGQGRGLGVSGPHRYYVSAIDPKANTVTLSDGSDLFREEIFCTDPNWIAVDALEGPREVSARFRHAKTETPCTILPTAEGGILVKAHTPVRAPTPGQLAVFYEGDVVVGSGWIS
ncbi:MAG: tRNA 2-thiouridine(34) synthase MnmA [Oscillospiraceae bacterium]|jgi:tRNA-specific 2-thiouridylase|nr:tRNA 2-thiouridine(34) synthase MnmA [Oscillospiraceae bacterium]